MKVAVEVQVVSRELVRPSSQTPPHLQHYQLSFLDTVAPPVYVPLVLFYAKDQNREDRNVAYYLKQSLSRVLTRYYPLAGRVKDNIYVLCNDEGAAFLEAKASCNLSEFITDPAPVEINKFLPIGLDEGGKVALATQVTTFSCGGTAIGIRVSHKLADGCSFVMFLKSWADTACGHALPSPQLVSAALFPPKNLSGFKSGVGIMKNEKIMTKRFVFDAAKIAALRAKYVGPLYPTRVEALSSFIWTHFVKVTDGDSASEKCHSVLHAVNLRKKMEPPLPETSFGNIFKIVASVPPIQSNGGDWYGVVGCVRDSIKNFDVKSIQQGDDYLKFYKSRSADLTKREFVHFNFSSWCRFPIYKTDFGWGTPLWVGLGGLPFKNLVVFMDTKCGEGIEAWVHMKEEDLVKFESSKELTELLVDTTSIT